MRDSMSQLINLQSEHLKQFIAASERQLKLSLDIMIHNFAGVELNPVKMTDSNAVKILHVGVNNYIGMVPNKPKEVKETKKAKATGPPKPKKESKTKAKTCLVAPPKPKKRKKSS